MSEVLVVGGCRLELSSRSTTALLLLALGVHIKRADSPGHKNPRRYLTPALPEGLLFPFEQQCPQGADQLLAHIYPPTFATFREGIYF